MVGFSGRAALLWVDAASESDQPTYPAESTFPQSAASIAFRQALVNGSGTGSLTVDDLVVATTFKEAKAAPPAVIARAMQSPRLADEVFRVKATTQAGVFYNLERQLSLSESTWNPVVTRTGTDAGAIHRLRVD